MVITVGMLPALRRLMRTPQAEYKRRGFAVLRGVLPIESVDRAATLSRSLTSFEGAHLRQSGQAEVNEFFPGTTLIRNPLLNLQLPLVSELQPLTDVFHQLLTAPTLVDALTTLDGAEHYHINQTLLFFAAQTTGIHLDSWAVDTVPHGGAHTLWIPLEDMSFRSGIPAVIPWPVGKLITEREFGLSTERPHAERYAKYHEALGAKLLACRPEIATALVSRGDVLVWSSLTPHFTMPPHLYPSERLSLQVLLRPARQRWGNFTVQPTSYPLTHVLPASSRISYFVPKEVQQETGLGQIFVP